MNLVFLSFLFGAAKCGYANDIAAFAAGVFRFPESVVHSVPVLF
ncbi:hypothetical protein [Caldibacillus debilis]|nr:hypothetical protein [Caldibacillus debilis]